MTWTNPYIAGLTPQTVRNPGGSAGNRRTRTDLKAFDTTRSRNLHFRVAGGVFGFFSCAISVRLFRAESGRRGQKCRVLFFDFVV